MMFLCIEFVRACNLRAKLVDDLESCVRVVFESLRTICKLKCLFTR